MLGYNVNIYVVQINTYINNARGATHRYKVWGTSAPGRVGRKTRRKNEAQEKALMETFSQEKEGAWGRGREELRRGVGEPRLSPQKARRMW